MPFARSRMTRRHMLAGTGGVLGAIALAACGQAMPAESGEMPEKAEEAKAEEPKPMEKATVSVRWISNDLTLVKPFYEDLVVARFNENYPNLELDLGWRHLSGHHEAAQYAACRRGCTRRLPQ